MVKKILCSVISFILCAVIAFVSCYFAIPSFNAWVNGIVSGNKTDDDLNNKQDGEDSDTSFSGGSAIGDIVDNGVTLLSAVLPRSAYEANGVPEQAETAYNLTAEVMPDYASNKMLDWSISWQDSESEWASGKEVTDYVTITPTTDGALTAVCACLQDFGEPVTLMVSSRSNPEVSGIIIVHYYQRVKSLNYSFKFDGEDIDVSADSHGVYKFDYTGAEKDYTVELIPVYSNYTLTDTYTTTVNGAFSSAFGYTANAKLTDLKITAGLIGGEPNDTNVNSLRSALKGIVSLVESGATGENVGIGMGQYYRSVVMARNVLSSQQSVHPFYLHVKNLIQPFTYTMTDFYGTQMPVAGNGASVSEIKSCLNSYVAPAYDYYGAGIPTYNDFVSAVRSCNTAGVGVLQYTVKINGAHSTYETVLNLGYNDDFKVTVQDINVSDTFIAF